MRRRAHMTSTRMGALAAPLTMHAVFWTATLAFFVLFFGRGAESYFQTVLFVVLLLPVAMATTYVMTGFLVPRFLLPGRFGLFALYGVYTIVGSFYLEMTVLVAAFIFLAGYEASSMIPATLDIFGLVVALYVVVFLALAGNLAMRWHRLRVSHDEAERARLEAELELRQAELARLKAQMQPHFLFNTLNNLYGLTLEQSERAPEVVLRISEMLDYVLYGCERPLVPLDEEIRHLVGYLELEQLRYDERVDVRLDLDDAGDEYCIAPFLLTPFVENSFKHGAARSTDTSWVHVRLRVEDERLYFDVENSKSASNRKPVERHRDEGIGLDNVRRRLKLLYPETHKLDINDRADRFHIHLSVPLYAGSERQEVTA